MCKDEDVHGILIKPCVPIMTVFNHCNSESSLVKTEQRYFLILEFHLRQMCCAWEFESKSNIHRLFFECMFMCQAYAYNTSMQIAP